MGNYRRVGTGGEGRRKRNETRTPRGHIVVYVGEEMRRHVVPIPYLKNPEFRHLLDEAAEAYGFGGGEGGRILLPCNEDTFRRVITSCKLH